MGLISHANLLLPENSVIDIIREDKKKTGLLERVINVSGYDQLITVFTRLVSYTQTERAGILVSAENSSNLGVFLINQGLDLTTTNRFLPDMQEMKEKFPENSSWYIVDTKESLSFFKGFFSSHEWSSLVSLYIKSVYPLGSDPFYIFLFKSKLDIEKNTVLLKTEPYILNLQKVLADNPLLVSSLQFSGSFLFSEQVAQAHIKSALDANKHATLACFNLDSLFSDFDILNTDPVQISLFRSLAFIIARLAGTSNLISMNDSGKIFTVIFSAQKIDTDLYFHQMLKPLEKTFGLHRVSRIKMEVLGTSASVSEILRFLAGGI